MSSLLNSVNTWWMSITGRERVLVTVCSVAIAFGVIYWGIMLPMIERADQAQSRLNSEKQLLSWVMDKADAITELRGSSGKPVGSTPLNQVVSSSSKRYQVELIRMQPRNEALQIWIKPLPFNRFIHWVTFLKESQGIDVEFMDISATDAPGVIEVKRLQLTR